MGKRWQLPGTVEPAEFQAVIGDIEDAISESGRCVGVLVDDGGGDLVIGVHGYEQQS